MKIKKYINFFFINLKSGYMPSLSCRYIPLLIQSNNPLIHFKHFVNPLTSENVWQKFSEQNFPTVQGQQLTHRLHETVQPIV